MREGACSPSSPVSSSISSPLFVVCPASFVGVVPVHPVVLAVLIVLVAGCPLPITPCFHPASSCSWPWSGVLCDGGCCPLAVLIVLVVRVAHSVTWFAVVVLVLVVAGPDAGSSVLVGGC